MARLKSKELGCYIPAFFEMHIDTDCDDLTINKLPLKDMTVLFHEYIHFLQDFTTYYGLNSIYAYSEYLHSVVNRIYGIKTKEFPVPFEIKDNSDNVLLNKQILNFTQGDTEPSTVFVVSEVDEDIWNGGTGTCFTNNRSVRAVYVTRITDQRDRNFHIPI